MLDLHSHTKGVAWPSFPNTFAMPVYAILFQLEHSQWFPPEALLEMQFRQLRTLLAHAARSVPFYEKRFESLDEAAIEALDPESWRELPILTRADIQDAGQDLRSDRLPTSHGKTGEIFSVGGNGQPIRVLRSQIWSYYRAAATMRSHLWHGRNLKGKLAAIRETNRGKHLYPRGTDARGWSQITREIFNNGPGVALNVNTPVPMMARWLQRQDPDYLLSAPGVIGPLADYCRANHILLPRLRQVETNSEIVDDSLREACREAWGVPLVDSYSTREAGHLALQCPEQRHYHVQSECVYLEVLDEAGRPCRPGETGRVVVTALHNLAMPLIRYEIGDLAEVGPPCPCGRGLPVLKRIVGRRQNKVLMPNGETRWPLLTSEAVAELLEVAPIRQYQLAQIGHDALEARLVIDRPLEWTEEERLQAWVAEWLYRPFEVTVTYHQDLPRTADGGFDDFVCELPR